jgi:hypothetical protein
MLGLRIIALRNPGHRVSICWRAPDSRQGKIIPPQQLLWKESEPGPSLIRPFAVRSAKPIDMIWFVFPWISKTSGAGQRRQLSQGPTTHLRHDFWSVGSAVV